MTPTPTPPPMVRVCWMDAQSDAHGWTPASELDREHCVVTTVGHLIADGRPGHLSVCLSYHIDGDELVVDSALHIPQAMVVSEQRLTTLPA